MLTRKQAQALAFIERYTADHGISPSLREIAAELGGSSQGNIQRMIGAMVERGYLRRIPGQHRGIEVIKGLKSTISAGGHSCPHCGKNLSVSIDMRAA